VRRRNEGHTGGKFAGRRRGCACLRPGCGTCTRPILEKYPPSSPFVMDGGPMLEPNSAPMRVKTTLMLYWLPMATSRWRVTNSLIGQRPNASLGPHSAWKKYPPTTLSPWKAITITPQHRFFRCLADGKPFVMRKAHLSRNVRWQQLQEPQWPLRNLPASKQGLQIGNKSAGARSPGVFLNKSLNLLISLSDLVYELRDSLFLLFFSYSPYQNQNFCWLA